MKRIIIAIITLTLFAIFNGQCVLHAQSPQFSIFDSFEELPKKNEGTVVIHQPESVKALVGTRVDSENIDVENGKTYIKTLGYKIQVYSGNNQRASKDEAFAKQAQVKRLYPSLSTRVDYKAPFWKLFVGDFRSFEEASEMLHNLKNDFPSIKNEIFIVEDIIRLQLDN